MSKYTPNTLDAEKLVEFASEEQTKVFAWEGTSVLVAKVAPNKPIRYITVHATGTLYDGGDAGEAVKAFNDSIKG